ncbi:Po1 beta superfamily nucleotidyltransferase [Cryptosporidium ryanae]|uniref:Po1 beta superfamily nucleotidyltransferase n=1 Tax=Cryptosporidium ryanae TaxID=515981 RepID=UPI00351A07EC|nr:Po1 beta superfamily nucleotidyltransferase [Cryptosporidium ryanae]
MTTSSNRYLAGNSERHNSSTNFEGLLGSSSDKKEKLINKSYGKLIQYNRRSRINNYSNGNNVNNTNSRLKRESSLEVDCGSYSEDHVKGQHLSGFSKKKMDRNIFVFDSYEVPQYRQNLRCLQNSPPPSEGCLINGSNVSPVAGNLNHCSTSSSNIKGGGVVGFYTRNGRFNNNNKNVFNVGIGNGNDNYKFQKYNLNSSNIISGHFSENYQLTPVHFPVVNQLSPQICNQILQGNICNYIPPPPDYHIHQESPLIKQSSFNCKINNSICDDTVSCGSCGSNINYSNNHSSIKSSNNNYNNGEMNCKTTFPFFQTPYSFRSYEISTLAAIDYLMPNMEFYDKISKVVFDLRNWMDNMNIPLFVFPYGSTSTGFADQFSDLDIALVPKQDVFESQNSRTSEITIKLKSNNSPITDINNKPAGLILQELLNLLQGNTNKDSDSSSLSSLSSNSTNNKFHDHPFTCIQDITSAHVPIIRMLHTKTDIVLDISIALCKLENLFNGINNNNNYYYHSLLDQPYYNNSFSSPNINYSNLMTHYDKKQKGSIGISDFSNNKRNLSTLRANSLPIIQSRLGILSWYAKLDPRVVHVVVLTKVWTRFRGLRNTLNGLPGGYAWTICVIYFFQKIGILPVIDPSEFIKKSQEFSTHITNEILGQIDDNNNSNGDFIFSNIDGICEDGSKIEITNFPSLPTDIKNPNSKIKNNNKSNPSIGINFNGIVNYNNDYKDNYTNNQSPSSDSSYGNELNKNNSELSTKNGSSAIEVENYSETFSTMENEKEIQINNNTVKLLYLDVVKGNSLASNGININKNSIKNNLNRSHNTISISSNNNKNTTSNSPEKSIGLRVNINNKKIGCDLLNNKNYNENNTGIVDIKNGNGVCVCKDNNEDDYDNNKKKQINEKNFNSDLDSDESTPGLSFMDIKSLSLSKNNNYDEEYDLDVFGESGRSSMGSTTFTYSPSPDNQSSDNLFIDLNSDSKFNNCSYSHTDRDSNRPLFSSNKGDDNNNYNYSGNEIISNKLHENKSKTTINSKLNGSLSSLQPQLSKSMPKIGMEIGGGGTGIATTVNSLNNNNLTKTVTRSKSNTLNKFNLDKAYNNTINMLFKDPPKLLNNVKTFDETSKYLKFSQSHILFYRFLLFLETHLWTTVIDISSPDIINTTSPGVCCNIRNPFPGPPACKPIFDQYHQEFLKSEIQRAIQIIQSPCGDFSSICGGYLDMPTDLKNNNIICGINRKKSNSFCSNINNSILNNNLNGVNCTLNHFNNYNNVNNSNRNNIYRCNLNNGLINSNLNCNCNNCSKLIQIHFRNNAQTINNNNNNLFNQQNKSNNHFHNKNKKNNHRNKDNNNHKIDMDINSSSQYYNCKNVELNMNVSCGNSYYSNHTSNNEGHFIGGAAVDVTEIIATSRDDRVAVVDTALIREAADCSTELGMNLTETALSITSVGVNDKISVDTSQSSTLYYDDITEISGADSLRHYVFSPLVNQLTPVHHIPTSLKDPINSNKLISTVINDDCGNTADDNGVVISGCKNPINKQHYLS